MKKKLLFLLMLAIAAVTVSQSIAAIDDGGTKSMKISSNWKCYSTGDACLGPV